MRTTLTLDPDVAERLRQEVIPGKTSLKQVVNDRLRIGLGLTTSEPSPPFKIRAHHSPYQPGVDPDKLNQLNDELEADAYLAALAIEHQAELQSRDTDFARFPGLRWRNPLR